MTGLRELVEAVREARVPAMAGVTATALDESAMPTYLMAVEALSEFILSTPDVLAAVEAVVALGEARAAKRTAQDAESAASDSFYSARARGEPSDGLDALRAETGRANKAHAVAHDAWAAANSTLCALADRLAARKGE